MMNEQQNTKKDDTIRILIAEERRLVRDAWSFILKKNTRFQVIAKCGGPGSALLHAKSLHPDIIIQEIKPPELSGIAMVSLVEEFSPGSKVLGVSLYTFPNIAHQVMKAGASGYITKTSPMEEMGHAIVEMHKGENYLCREIKKTYKKQPEESNDPEVILNHLSLREIEVAVGIKNGLAPWEIADQLNIVEPTVEMHRYRILKKLNLKENAELVALLNNLNAFVNRTCQ